MTGRLPRLVCYLAAILLAGAVAQILARYAFDDAYIHFRIARNLVETGLPYYNPGEAVMGTSSPLWTLVLGGLFFFVGPSPTAVAWLEGIILVLGALSFSRLLRESAEPGAPVWLSACFALPYLALVQYAGLGLMETPLALLALSEGLRLHSRDRPIAFVPLTLVAFLRLEFTIFPVLCLLRVALRSRGTLPRSLCIAALAAAPLLLMEWFWFGTVIPHTVWAKSIVYTVPPGAALVSMLHEVDGYRTWLPSLGQWLDGAILIALVVAATAGWFASAADPVRRASRDALVLLGAGGLVVAAFYAGSAGLVFPWYVPLATVPLAAALWGLSARRLGPGVVVLLAVGVATPSAASLARTVWAAAGHPEVFRHFAQNARTRTLLEIGDRLRVEYPGARLLAPEIGALGFAFEGPVIDAVGLVSPNALRFHPMRVPEERRYGFLAAVPPGLVEEERPELIVGLEVFLEALLASDTARDYVVRREPIFLDDDRRRLRSATLWWSRSIDVLVRRTDAAEAPESGEASAPPHP